MTGSRRRRAKATPSPPAATIATLPGSDVETAVPLSNAITPMQAQRFIPPNPVTVSVSPMVTPSILKKVRSVILSSTVPENVTFGAPVAPVPDNWTPLPLHTAPSMLSVDSPIWIGEGTVPIRVTVKSVAPLPVPGNGFREPPRECRRP